MDPKVSSTDFGIILDWLMLNLYPNLINALPHTGKKLMVNVKITGKVAVFLCQLTFYRIWAFQTCRFVHCQNFTGLGWAERFSNLLVVMCISILCDQVPKMSTNASNDSCFKNKIVKTSWVFSCTIHYHAQEQAIIGLGLHDGRCAPHFC